MSSTGLVCKICETEKAKYTCPKCNINYCSLDCYKNQAHIACSESFYKKCIDDELKSAPPNSEAKKKMMEILTRAKNEENDFDMDMEGDEQSDESLDSDDDESVPDIEERFKNIDLDDAEQVWETLTEDERKEFEAMLSGKDVTKIIPSWEPWWLYYQLDKLVEEIGESETTRDDDYKNKCPPILQGIPEFSALCKTRPSPCIYYNILNVLSAYTFIVRYFNGDHHSLSNESAAYLYSISGNLKSNSNFDDEKTAYEAVIQEIVNSSSIEFDSDSRRTIIEDLQCLIRGPKRTEANHYMLCALSDIHKLLNNSRKIQKDSETRGAFAKRFPIPENDSSSSLPKDKIKSILKKLEFFLSYVKSSNCDLSQYK